MNNIIVFENKIDKYDNCPDIYFVNENLSIKDIGNFFSFINDANISISDDLKNDLALSWE